MTRIRTERASDRAVATIEAAHRMVDLTLLIPLLISLLIVAHAGATLALVGLIWVIQVVQYPLFAAVPSAGFLAFHQGHMRRITWVVAPLMLIEAATAVLLLVESWRAPEGPIAHLLTPLAVGAALLVVIWIVTFAISVPCHERLSRGFDPMVHHRLVRTNWLRTAGWTVRGLLALSFLTHAPPP